MTLQFYVFILMWQIRFPAILRFTFYELKKLALGEFLDDLKIGETVLD